jgi:hypothetical protein
MLLSSSNPFSFFAVVFNLVHRVSKTSESGLFLRTIIEENGYRKQKTVKFNKNTEKVFLGSIGELQVYAYPFRFPDCVFIGDFPVSTKIDLSNAKAILGAYNKIKWFLAGEWRNKAKSSIRTGMRRQQIQRAYDCGLDNEKNLKSSRLRTNYNLDTNAPIQVFKCPFCEAQIWFNRAMELTKHIRTEKNHGDKNHSQKYDLEKCKVWVAKNENGIWKVLSYEK